MKRTIKKLAKAVLADLYATYDLVYVDQSDKLTDEQVGAIVSGDYEKLWDSTSEWESDARASSSEEILKSAVADVIRAWEVADERDYSALSDKFLDSERATTVRDTIQERDSGEWIRNLVRATPPVLLRILVIDEDNAYRNEDVEPEAALLKVGLPITERNIAAMGETLANASPEFSSLMGFWIIGADVEQLFDLDSEATKVTITNPHLYLGNPLMGDGYISDSAFEGVVTIDRDSLRTDKDAFGYSVESIYGGLTASEYSADITPINPNEEE